MKLKGKKVLVTGKIGFVGLNIIALVIITVNHEKNVLIYF